MEKMSFELKNIAVYVQVLNRCKTTGPINFSSLSSKNNKFQQKLLCFNINEDLPPEYRPTSSQFPFRPDNKRMLKKPLQKKKENNNNKNKQATKKISNVGQLVRRERNQYSWAKKKMHLYCAFARAPS